MIKLAFRIPILFLVALFLAYPGLSNIHYQPKPEHVTVFQSGAIINSEFKLNLNKGTNFIFLDSMPSIVDKNSIRISLEGNAQVMSYDFRLEPQRTNEIVKPPSILSVEDSIRQLNYRKTDLMNQKEVLSGEEKLIKEYKVERYDEKGAKIIDLQSMAQYYNKRINEIKKEILKLDMSIYTVNMQIAELQKVVDEYLKTGKIIQNYQIYAVVSSESTGEIGFSLNYFTSNAYWTLSYEIKAENSDSPIKLLYKGSVWQSCGIDWNDVKLTLSTRNPTVNNNLPVLNPWYLRYSAKEINAVYEDSPLTPQASNVRRSRSDKEVQIIVDGLQLGTMADKYFAVEYNPTNKYTIKSDNQKQSITLNEETIKADFEHFAIPKTDPDAFLIAKINNWGDLKLLQGEAFIYFENSYVGKITINPLVAADTLVIPLGRDKGVLIQRTIIQEFTETKFLSSNVVRTLGYKITVKNNRKKSVKITLQDQIPVSTHEDIEVTLIDGSGAKPDQSGIIKWIKVIDANKTEELKLIFKVDLPGNARF